MKNFIEEYQLSDITICDGLLDLFEDAKQKGLATEGKCSVGVVDKSKKASTDFFLVHSGSLGPPQKYKFNQYHEELKSFIQSYMQTYKMDGLDLIARHLPQIQHYAPGQGFYSWHVDGYGLDACDRALVYITYLNDVTEGGGTEFYHQEYTVKPIKGKTVIFPAGLTHLHRGEVSQTQDKYIITGWLWWT